MAISFTINPNGTGVQTGWTPTLGGGQSFLWQAVADASDASYGQADAPSPNTSPCTFELEDIPVNGGSLVYNVVVNCRFYYGGSNATTQIRATLNGVNVDSGTLTLTGGATYQDRTLSLPNKPGGGQWTVNDINALRTGALGGTWDAFAPRIVKVTVTGSYDPIPGSLARVRSLGSTRLWYFQRGRQMMEGSVPLDFLDVDLDDLVPITHHKADSDTGTGWGLLPWERRPFGVAAKAIDLDRMTVKAGMVDLHPTLCMLWDTGKSRISSDSFANGVARMERGAARVFDRDSKAWIADPSDGRIVEVGVDVEAMDAQGQVIERASTNVVPRSSFRDGTTGWTLFQGAGAGTITIDTGDLFFDPSFYTAGVGGALVLTAANPHTVNLVAESPTSASKAANTIVRPSFYYKAPTGTTLCWRLRRNVDSFYWNDATSTWAAPITNNVLADSSIRTFGRSLAGIDIGGAASTLTLAVALVSGGTGGRVGTVYHAQLDNRAITGTIIATDAAEVTRAASRLYHQTSGVQWPGRRGTLYCTVKPLFNHADVSGARTIAYASMSPAGDWVRMQHTTQGGTRFRLQMNVNGGSTVSVSIPANITRLAEYHLAARWVSDVGEHGDAAYSMRLYLYDPAVGSWQESSAVTVGDYVDLSSVQTLDIGSELGTDQFDGHIYNIVLRQTPDSFTKIKTFPF